MTEYAPGGGPSFQQDDPPPAVREAVTRLRLAAERDMIARPEDLRLVQDWITAQQAKYPEVE